MDKDLLSTSSAVLKDKEEERHPSPKNVLPAMMDHHSTFVDDLADDLDDLIENGEPNRGNKGWTEEKKNTVRRWQKDIERASFVFGERLDNISNDLQRVQVYCLAGSGVIGLLSVLSLTMGAITPQTPAQVDALRWTPFAFSCVSAVIAAIVLFYSNRTQVLGWNHQIRELSQFVGELNRTWVAFEKELMVPYRQKMNANEFLSRNSSIYSSLMERCPDIKAEEYVEASQAYMQRLADNLIWTKRFRLSTNEALSEIVVQK